MHYLLSVDADVATAAAATRRQREMIVEFGGNTSRINSYTIYEKEVWCERIKITRY